MKLRLCYRNHMVLALAAQQYGSHAGPAQRLAARTAGGAPTTASPEEIAEAILVLKRLSAADTSAERVEIRMRARAADDFAFALENGVHPDG